MRKICMVGTGYVGLVSGACLADFGNRVMCVDIDEERINMIKSGVMPIYEPGLKEMVERNHRAGRLEFTTDLEMAVRESQVIFSAVGTPQNEDGSCDLTAVFKVAEDVARYIDEYKVFVQKSTVPVGTSERVGEVIEKNLKRKVEFDRVSNPEFLREGSAIEDFMRPNRVVIGVETERAREIMREIYRPLYLLETPIVFTSIRTAELIKYASNAFLATKISFINEIADLCEKVGADVDEVAVAMGLDKRIGPKFLHAGVGYGGSCLPKDVAAILHTAKEVGVDLKIIAKAKSKKEKCQFNILENKIIFLYAGNIWPERLKMLKQFIDIFTKKVNDEAVLIICGAMSLDTKKRFKNLKDDKVIYLGLIPHSELLKLYKEIDVVLVFIDSSMRDHNYSHPGKLFEAMAMGKIVVISNFATARRLIKDGYNGFILNDDFEFICNKLIKAMNNIDLRKRIENNAVKSVKFLDWNLLNKKWYLELEQKILKEDK